MIFLVTKLPSTTFKFLLSNWKDPRLKEDKWKPSRVPSQSLEDWEIPIQNHYLDEELPVEAKTVSTIQEVLEDSLSGSIWSSINQWSMVWNLLPKFLSCMVQTSILIFREFRINWSFYPKKTHTTSRTPCTVLSASSRKNSKR